MLLGRRLRRVKVSLSSRCRCSGVPVSCIIVITLLKFLILPFIEGQQLRYCGVGAGYDDIIIDGSLDDLKVWLIRPIHE